MVEKLVDIGTKELQVSIHGNGAPIVVIETGMGHSFGGLCVQHFACLFPEKVAAMVLIDSNSVDEYKMDELRDKLPSFKNTFSKSKIIDNWRSLSRKSKDELKTIISPELLQEQRELTEEMQKCILDFQINPNMHSAMASELELMCQSGQEIKKHFKQLDIPLKVLGRDKALGIKWNADMGISEYEGAQFESLWSSLVIEEANNSAKGQFVEVKGSKHSIYRTNPEVVIKAIKDAIAEI